MIRVEVTNEFTLSKFKEIKNLKRADPSKNEDGWLYLNDTFECDEKMAKYLTGDNSNNYVVVKVIEVVPEPVKEVEKPKPTIKKKNSKKKYDY